MELSKQSSAAKEGRGTAHAGEEVWWMWRKQLLGAKMPLSEAVGGKLGTEARMARKGGKSNKERSIGGKVWEGLGRAEADSDNREVRRLWSIQYTTMERTYLKVP